MPFKTILVALDGSTASRNAADYGFWLSAALQAKLSAQHVVDPHLSDNLLTVEVADELAVHFPEDARERFIKAQKRAAISLLDLFKRQSEEQSVDEIQTCIDVGSVSSNILKRANKADLTIVGQHGSGQNSDDHPVTGSIANRVAVESKSCVLLVRQPIQELGPIIVAYDGSATTNGALALAERLAVAMRKELKVIHVAPNKEQFAKAKVLMQKAATHLSEKAKEYGSSEEGEQFLDKVVFMVREGHPAETLVDFARMTNGLLVFGANGARPRSHKDFFGKTASYILRKTNTSLLIFRESVKALSATD